jgi:hypothetical protein
MMDLGFLIYTVDFTGSIHERLEYFELGRTSFFTRRKGKEVSLLRDKSAGHMFFPGSLSASQTSLDTSQI